MTSDTKTCTIIVASFLEALASTFNRSIFQSPTPVLHCYSISIFLHNIQCPSFIDKQSDWNVRIQLHRSPIIAIIV